MVITISGLPGSGKTTVARLVARELGLEHVYAGEIFRRQAQQRGIPLAEYLKMAETDESIDRDLDAQMLARAAAGSAVLEGRLTAYIADKAGVPALRVFLDASEDVRAERITGREGGATTERLREIQAREASDRRRYRVLYGVDYHDRRRYDLVMETDRHTPDELARAIVGKARARFPG
jgi:predicted cytidylate kinase